VPDLQVRESTDRMATSGWWPVAAADCFVFAARVAAGAEWATSH
jgi:hypothetical protein